QVCAGRHDPRNLIGLTRCPVKNPNRVARCITATRGRQVDCLLRHEVARLIVWHVGVTRPAVPSAVSYADVRLRRESSMEECRKTSGIQGPDEPLELSFIDHSMG